MPSVSQCEAVNFLATKYDIAFNLQARQMDALQRGELVQDKILIDVVDQEGRTRLGGVVVGDDSGGGFPVRS
ncbi:MAG: hypothetical protein EOO81_04435 [Oxalobacteraceae bacterium]|nr:MAG: hypothetical protein EOO81_04435 [Oxalobacteraceae bacterium]